MCNYSDPMRKSCVCHALACWVPVRLKIFKVFGYGKQHFRGVLCSHFRIVIAKQDGKQPESVVICRFFNSSIIVSLSAMMQRIGVKTNFKAPALIFC